MQLRGGFVTMGTCNQRYNMLLSTEFNTELNIVHGEGARLFELEEELGAVLKNIETAKEGIFYSRKIVFLTAKEFQQESVAHPCITASKCALVIIALGGLPMVVIGSVACFNYYRISPIDQVFTSVPAMINYSNEGQSITYLAQAVEFILMPAALLFLKNPYNKAKTKAIKSIYLEKIAQATLSLSQVHFLIDRANRDLAKYGHLPLPVGDSSDEIYYLKNQLEAIEEELEHDKYKLLSLRHITYLVTCDMLKEVKSASMLSSLKKGLFSFALIGATAAAWQPLMMGVFGNIAPFNQQSPLGLLSDDPEVLENTTSLYSNLGHVPEYIATGLLISGVSLKILFWEKYCRIRRQLIDQIYDKHIRNSELDPRISDLLYRKKQSERGHVL